ncbi:mechanosensitive ion channel family protein [Chelatococcus sp. GCM10030263]|uniref:mechanosensitive ion channel family protein n=1 Tax=Chelatococcus sp. GCM10030263 TaxID=3273387 RepID=UPI0036136C22
MSISAKTIAISVRAGHSCQGRPGRSIAGPIAAVFTILMLLLGPAYGQAIANWSGTWDTKWRDGGAQLILEQNGTQVTGSYPLYNGRVEGTVEGDELKGRWTEDGRSGEFLFVQGPDGHSFMGRFSTSSEWWTGIRVDAARYQAVPVDQSSPMTTMRSFLEAMNESGADNIQRDETGSTDLTGKAAALLDVTRADRGGVNLIDYTRQFYAVVDKLTFRLWSLPHDGIDGDQVTATLGQFGSRITFDVTFRRKDGRWFIVGPPLAALQSKRDELLQARSEPPDTVLDPRKLRSPRDSFKILLGGFMDEQGRSTAYTALDMRELSSVVKSDEADLLARYIKKVLDRVGYVYWQEIPDDPNSRAPYVHFEHPSGKIVVAPVETKDGVIWQFTPDTLASIRALYADVEEMPVAPELAERQTTDLYFETRNAAQSINPELLARAGPLERWQWLLLVFACLVGLGFGFLISGLIFGFVRQGRRTAIRQPEAVLERVLAWSVRAISLGLFLLAALRLLGLPDIVATPVQAAAWVCVVVGSVPLAWHLIGVVAESYRRRWVSPGYHETLISLTSGAIRVAIIIAAFLLLAEVLAIPYQGVIAGLGIGGLAVALAAQPTLQNFLSGLTLYADRPISVGDFCRFGDKLGTVEYIGMRSTRVRSVDRTVISVPNSEFANMQLENFTRRDRICFTTKLQLRYETTADQLRYVIAELRKLFIGHPRVADEPCRVRFIGFGEYSLDVEIFSYVLTRDFSEFTAVREDILLRIMAIMDEAGTQFAFPSQIEYHAEDTPIDAERRAGAERRVQAWRDEQKLPFPEFDEADKVRMRNGLPYPPEGSAIAVGQGEDLAPELAAAAERWRWNLRWSKKSRPA